MNCPKCTGLLVQEEIQEQGGRFQGWRCIQCGLRLDQQILHNRPSAPPEPSEDDLDQSPSSSRDPLEITPSVRFRRPMGSA